MSLVSFCLYLERHCLVNARLFCVYVENNDYYLIYHYKLMCIITVNPYLQQHSVVIMWSFYFQLTKDGLSCLVLSG